MSVSSSVDSEINYLGEYFTGKNPSDFDVRELTSNINLTQTLENNDELSKKVINVASLKGDDDFIYDSEENSNLYEILGVNQPLASFYTSLKKLSIKSKLLPSFYYSQPTQKEYD